MGCFFSKEAGSKYRVKNEVADGEHALPIGEPPEEGHRKVVKKVCEYTATARVVGPYSHLTSKSTSAEHKNPQSHRNTLS